MPEDSVTQVAVTAPEPQADAEPTFKEFSDARRNGTVDATAGGDVINPGGNRFNPEKNAWENSARDEQTGRFAKAKSSLLAEAEKRARYVASVRSGSIQPDESMDASTWIAAREATLRHGTAGITPPDFGETGKPTDNATDADVNTVQQQQLTEKEQREVAAHQAFMSVTAARVALDPATKEAVLGFKKAVDGGADPHAIDYLGVVISGVENPSDVLLTLGRNQEALGMFSRLPIESMQAAVHALSQQLAGQKKTALQVPPKEPKPKPPDPVGARASASGFDVNDESIDADSWARQRNEQLAKKGRR